MTLLHIAYAEPGKESAAKMLDFAAASVRERWAQGYADTRKAIDALRALPDAQTGFRAYRFAGGVFSPYG